MTGEIQCLLELSKNTARIALDKLIELSNENKKHYSYDQNIPNEIKATADTVIEKIILDKLHQTGIDILSEESGFLAGNKRTSLKFIIDPIDGTVNFVRGITECSVSIALYDGQVAVFGVIASFPSNNIAWGGINIEIEKYYLST